MFSNVGLESTRVSCESCDSLDWSPVRETSNERGDLLEPSHYCVAVLLHTITFLRLHNPLECRRSLCAKCQISVVSTWTFSFRVQYSFSLRKAKARLETQCTMWGGSNDAFNLIIKITDVARALRVVRHAMSYTFSRVSSWSSLVRAILAVASGTTTVYLMEQETIFTIDRFGMRSNVRTFE